jgi:hypothetical protein
MSPVESKVLLVVMYDQRYMKNGRIRPLIKRVERKVRWGGSYPLVTGERANEMVREFFAWQAGRRARWANAYTWHYREGSTLVDNERVVVGGWSTHPDKVPLMGITKTSGCHLQVTSATSLAQWIDTYDFGEWPANPWRSVAVNAWRRKYDSVKDIDDMLYLHI